VSSEDRTECLFLIKEAVKNGARKEKACELLEVSIRTIERWENNLEDKRKGPISMPSNALTKEERSKVLEVANSAEYANLAPSQIVPKLADKGDYVASESSFYRILKKENLLNHRARCNPRIYKTPDELVAFFPNQIWSWDITYLKAAIKGRYYYLYLPMDVFSRKIVYWKVYESESAEYASAMISSACELNNISRDQITLHSDNGGPMKGATMLATLQRLGVATSFSRPHVSNDNPFSESLFRTLKYCPSFPDRGFASLEEAIIWVEKFVNWYNNIHLHSGINFVTPASRHDGRDDIILKNRHNIYEEAKRRTPNRWSKKTRNWSRINLVELNPRKQPKLVNKLNAA
jgi:transposase InsO family protein